MPQGQTLYEELVNMAGYNYSRYYQYYAQGGVPVELSTREEPYKEQIAKLATQIQEADVIVVGAAAGLSAAGGGDFYYGDSPSWREHFGKYTKRFGFEGAFVGMRHRWKSPEERWGFLATFLHTTQSAPLRKPYLDLDVLVQGKDSFMLTTNQDTQLVKLYPEDKVAQIQGDHRYFQCSKPCCDHLWDAVEPVNQMFEAMGDGFEVPTELIPRCPHCGAEAFPWVRGYGNLLEGERYHAEYAKAGTFIEAQRDRKALLLEIGVGRMTPMFIQEPFWNLTLAYPHARYVTINSEHALLPRQIEDKGMAIKADIAQTLIDTRKALGR